MGRTENITRQKEDIHDLFNEETLPFLTNAKYMGELFARRTVELFEDSEKEEIIILETGPGTFETAIEFFKTLETICPKLKKRYATVS